MTEMGLMFVFSSLLSAPLRPVGLQIHYDCSYSNIADSVGQVTRVWVSVHVCVNVGV